jgi:alpha-galactosidase
MTKPPTLLFADAKGGSSACEIRHRGKPLPIKIGYVGGGSRGWAPMLMMDLALCPFFRGEVALYDLDPAAAALNVRYGNLIQSGAASPSNWRYRAARSLADALRGCDFVFLSIQPGPIGFMRHDLEIPARYGVYQSVGDTVGPGGIVRGFRSARIYRGFAEGIAEHAPRAWVLNFTNPMSVCTRTLHRVFPGIKAYGCCHEVFSTQLMLGRLYAHYLRRPFPNRAEVRVNVLGINHFTWVDRASCRGVDLLPLFRRYMEKPDGIRLYPEWRDMGPRQLARVQRHFRLTFELARHFGLLPAAGTRHLAEFVPWFLHSPESGREWGFRMIPWASRAERWKQAPRRFARQLAGKEPVEIRPSNEEYLNQMAALAGLTTLVTNVNLPNRGQMEGVPRDRVVETNARFSRDRVLPLASGRLPPALDAWVNLHASNQEDVVEAALGGDEELGFRAFASDPLVHRLPLDRARKMFGEMLRATRFRF